MEVSTPGRKETEFLKIVSVSAWIVLLFCTVQVICIAISAPNFISSTVINGMSKEVQGIWASKDLADVKQTAVLRARGEAYAMSSARSMLAISVLTMVLCMFCSSVSLIHVRKLRKLRSLSASLPSVR